MLKIRWYVWVCRNGWCGFRVAGGHGPEAGGCIMYHYTYIYQCLSVNLAPSGSTCRSSYTGPVAACPLAGFSVFKRLDMPDFVEQIPSSCMEGTHTHTQTQTHKHLCVSTLAPLSVHSRVCLLICLPLMKTSTRSQSDTRLPACFAARWSDNMTSKFKRTLLRLPFEYLNLLFARDTRDLPHRFY